MVKRKLKRRHLIFYLQVFCEGELIGQIADITEEGFMLLSKDKIETNKVYSLRMELPDSIKGTKALYFDAKSIWSKLDINPDFHVTGFKIVNLDESDVELIKDLIAELGFNDEIVTK